jgi:hypothetical protein
MRQVLIDALEKQYEAEIASADATIKLLLENSVAVAVNILGSSKRIRLSVAQNCFCRRKTFCIKGL